MQKQKMKKVSENLNGDKIVKAIYPFSENGCIIIYQTEHWLYGNEVYSIAINGDGNYLGFLDILDEYSVTPLS
mgnify:CR=1 FL=1